MKTPEIKYIGECPTCTRGIEAGDDVVERKGIMYHDGCEPEGEVEPVKPAVVEVAEVVSQPPLVIAEQKGKKMTKQEKQDMMLEQLLGLVTTLAHKVTELETRQVAPVATAGTTAKKSKNEKGAPRPDVYYVVKGYPSENRPPQCLKVFRAIAQACPADGKMTEMQVWDALMAEKFPAEVASKNVGSWNYRQTPFYIFRYYRKDMINAGFVLGPFDVV